jgi:hypothetical protein
MPPYVAQRAGHMEGMIPVQATPSTVQQTTTSVPLGKSTVGTWPVVRLLTGREFMKQLYREGKLLNLPNPQPLSPEEQAERERLAQLLAGGKSMSEIISEGRGSY